MHERTYIDWHFIIVTCVESRTLIYLLYDRDYASALCALLPLPSPTARTSNVIALYGKFSGCAGLVNNFGILFGLVL
jgi:hypothetical protein